MNFSDIKKNYVSFFFLILLTFIFFFSKKFIVFNEEFLVIISSLTILMSIIFLGGEFISNYLNNIALSILSKFYYVYSIKNFQLSMLRIFYLKRNFNLTNFNFEFFFSLFSVLNIETTKFLNLFNLYIYLFFKKELDNLILLEKSYGKQFFNSFLKNNFSTFVDPAFIDICYKNYYNFFLFDNLSKKTLNNSIKNIPNNLI